MAELAPFGHMVEEVAAAGVLHHDAQVLVRHKTPAPPNTGGWVLRTAPAAVDARGAQAAQLSMRSRRTA
jgi:hypothetical protein